MSTKLKVRREKLTRANYSSVNSSNAFGFGAKPIGYWNSKSNNRRQAFEDFARGFNLDPLNPDTWYSLGSAILLHKVSF